MECRNIEGCWDIGIMGSKIEKEIQPKTRFFVFAKYSIFHCFIIYSILPVLLLFGGGGLVQFKGIVKGPDSQFRIL